MTRRNFFKKISRSTVAFDNLQQTTVWWIKCDWTSVNTVFCVCSLEVFKKEQRQRNKRWTTKKGISNIYVSFPLAKQIFMNWLTLSLTPRSKSHPYYGETRTLFPGKHDVNDVLNAVVAANYIRFRPRRHISACPYTLRDKWKNMVWWFWVSWLKDSRTQTPFKLVLWLCGWLKVIVTLLAQSFPRASLTHWLLCL